MNEQWFLVEGVNPEPWVASEGHTGSKGGKTFIRFHKPDSLRFYQEALKEEFVRANPHAVERPGDISLYIYFWRQLSVGSMFEEEGAQTRTSNSADATNLQKSTEDALQGVLYANDRNIRSVRSVIVEQSRETTPAILICIGDFDASEEEEAAQVRAQLHQPTPDPVSNFRHFDVTDVF